MNVVYSIKMALWSKNLPSGTSTEHKPEMAKDLEDVLMASGKSVHQNSTTNQQMPRKKIMRQQLFN